MIKTETIYDVDIEKVRQFIKSTDEKVAFKVHDWESFEAIISISTDPVRPNKVYHWTNVTDTAFVYLSQDLSFWSYDEYEDRVSETADLIVPFKDILRINSTKLSL